MNTQTIKINNTNYTVKFGILSDKILGDKWNLKKPSEVFKNIQKGFNLKQNQEPTFDQLIIISQLILSGIKSAQPTAEIDEDDVYKVIISDATVMVNLITLYTKSQPQITAEESKNVNPDQRKKK